MNVVRWELFQLDFTSNLLFFFCVPDMTLQDVPALNVSVLQILVC